VRGDVLGLPLHDVVERTDLNTSDLTESDRSAIYNGIVSSHGLEGARNVVTLLTGRKLEPCRVISTTDAPTAPTTAVNTTPLPQPTGIPGVTCRAA
jgi:hypothetical protein